MQEIWRHRRCWCVDRALTIHWTWVKEISRAARQACYYRIWWECGGKEKDRAESAKRFWCCSMEVCVSSHVTDKQHRWVKRLEWLTMPQPLRCRCNSVRVSRNRQVARIGETSWVTERTATNAAPMHCIASSSRSVHYRRPQRLAIAFYSQSKP